MPDTIRKVPRHFPEGGQETTNLRWGIESVIRELGIIPTPSMIIMLEAYFMDVVVAPDHMDEGDLECAALIANNQFEGE